MSVKNWYRNVQENQIKMVKISEQYSYRSGNSDTLST